SWNETSERKAPTRPTKLAGPCAESVLKNQTGSVGSYETSAMSQIRAVAKSATPRNSLRRRDSADSATSCASARVGHPHVQHSHIRSDAHPHTSMTTGS